MTIPEYSSKLPALVLVVGFAGACGEAGPSDDLGELDPDGIEALELAVTEARTVGELRDLLPEDALPPDLRDVNDDAPIRVGLPQPGDEPSWDPVAPDEPGFATEAPDPDFNSGCATANINVPISGSNGKQVTFAQGTATSPTASYDPFGCPRRFITEVTGTYGQSFDVVAQWASTPPTLATCEDSYVAATTYGRRLVFQYPFQVSYVWDTLDSHLLGGVVVEIYGGAPVCVFVPDDLALASFEDSEYGVLRVAAQAYRNLGVFGKSYRRVTAGVD